MWRPKYQSCDHDINMKIGRWVFSFKSLPLIKRAALYFTTKCYYCPHVFHTSSPTKAFCPLSLLHNNFHFTFEKIYKVGFGESNQILRSSRSHIFDKVSVWKQIFPNVACWCCKFSIFCTPQKLFFYAQIWFRKGTKLTFQKKFLTFWRNSNLKMIFLTKFMFTRGNRFPRVNIHWTSI